MSRKGLLLVALVGCSTSAKPVAPAPTPAAAPPTVTIDAGTADLVVDAAADPTPPREAEPSLEDVAKRLAVSDPRPCSDVHCVIDAAYHDDAKAAAEARDVWDKWKIVPGVEDPYTMNGDFRGMIRIVPAIPVNGYRKHLEWVTAALADIEQFFAELKAYGAAHGVPPSDKMYRWKPRELRFFRSVGRTTPSAYVDGGRAHWMIAFNVVGSLNVSVDAARETMMHEIFHLNDPERTGRPWSETALTPMFDPIVKKCGTKIACLTPYTPNETRVRGGTYYSFQPGNGSTVMEYAAELALRYYRENRAALRSASSSPKPKAFKCGPAENGRAWAAMRDDWFGGIDAVPPCP